MLDETHSRAVPKSIWKPFAKGLILSGGSRSAKLSPREAELARLLSHAVDCLNIDCKFCDKIQRDLEDGAQYIPEDPTQKWSALDQAIVATLKQSEELADFLECTSLPINARRSALTLTQGIQMIQKILHQPLTGASARRKTRRAVTFESLKLISQGSGK